MKRKGFLLLTIYLIITIKFFAGNGKIVFSKSPINAETGETVQAETFSDTDNIYYQVYLPKTLSSYKTKWGPPTEYFIIIYNNKKQLYSWTVQVPNNEVSTFGAILTKSFEDQKKINSKLMEAFNRFEPGTYDLTAEIAIRIRSASEVKVIAEGKFSFVKSENKLKIGKSFNDYISRMNSPDLEANTLKYFQTTFSENSGSTFTRFAREGDTYIKTKIMDPDWTINRHPDSGVITGRQIEVAVLVRQKDGECQVYRWYLEQSYMGAGSGYQKSFHVVEDALPIDHQITVDCE
jgi:hypothetical protein